jgi:photosystem II stability/assembly factor-like uncharacterized protein
MCQSGWFLQYNSLSFQGTYNSIFFLDTQNGWLTVSSSSLGACNLYSTTNGGTNWNLLNNPNTHLSSVYFINQLTGWACSGTIPISGGSGLGVIYKTTNGGINFITQDYPIYQSPVNDRNLTYIKFLNENTGYACGNIQYVFGQSLVIDVYILKTTNGGTNWTVPFRMMCGESVFDYHFNNLDFTDENNIWVCGNYGMFLRSTNGGLNWIQSTFDQSKTYKDVRFINQNTGFLIYSYGWSGNGYPCRILKTINGGSVFDTIYYSNIYKLRSLYFIDENNGWMCGDSNTIKKTTNSGQNWYSQNTPIFTNYYRVYFTNLNTGWAVDFSGNILKTITGGSSLFSISGIVRYADNNQPITSGVVKAIKLNPGDVSLMIVDTAVIQSDGTYILQHIPQDSVYIGVYPSSGQQVDYVISYYPSTTDWQSATVLYPTGNLSNINISAFRMTTTTASNSVSGKVMRLTDVVTGNLKDAVLYAKNGNTYVRCTVSDVNGVYHLQSLPSGNLKIIINRLGFIGDSTNVNVTSTSNIDSVNFHLYRFTVGIKQIGIEVPNEFKLYQNYPNPFNPVTKIKFEIPSNGFPIGALGNDRVVVLKVYDILGREIQTLVNETLQPGSYEVTFGGSNLSSGIYFYQLKAGDYIETKKMVLLK